MEYIIEKIAEDQIKKCKNSFLDCLKRFSCKSNCMINEEEHIRNVEESKNELLEILKYMKRKSLIEGEIIYEKIDEKNHRNNEVIYYENNHNLKNKKNEKVMKITEL